MKIKNTRLSGLFLIELDIFTDERGSFREVWQNEKLKAAGLPEIKPIQMNISESKKGVIRGIHAEPWDKYIHVIYGLAFAVIVDLRPQSETFAQWQSFQLDQTVALFVSEGLGNSFQVLSDKLVYSYLVTGHWQPDNPYPSIAFNDSKLAIPWPIRWKEQIVSEKDRHNLTLTEAFKI